MSKITTRTGDNGSTGLADGTRPGNGHARITALPYLNRLSDLLFVLCRVINQAQETLWQRNG